MQRAGAFINGLAFLVLLLGVMGSPFLTGGVSALGTLVVRSSVIVAGSLALLSYLFVGKWNWPSRWTLIPLATFALTIIWSISRLHFYSSYQEALNVLSYILAFILAAHLMQSVVQQRLVLLGIALLAIGMSTYGIMQIFGIEYFTRAVPGDTHKVSSFYFNQAHYGGLLVLLIPLTWSLFLYSNRWFLGILWLLICIVLGVNLLFTSSWDAFIPALMGILVASIVWGISKRRYIQLSLIVVLFVGLVGGTYFTFTQSSETVKRLLGISSAELETYIPRVVETRLEIYRIAWKTAKASNWLGVGIGQFSNNATLHRPENAQKSVDAHKFINYAHNDYLQILSELGIAGLVAWLGLWLVTIFHKSNVAPPISIGIAAGIVSLLLHGFTDANFNIMPGTVLLAWFLGGLKVSPIPPKPAPPQPVNPLESFEEQIY